MKIVTNSSNDCHHSNVMGRWYNPEPKQIKITDHDNNDLVIITMSDVTEAEKKDLKDKYPKALLYQKLFHIKLKDVAKNEASDWLIKLISKYEYYSVYGADIGKKVLTRRSATSLFKKIRAKDRVADVGTVIMTAMNEELTKLGFTVSQSSATSERKQIAFRIERGDVDFRGTLALTDSDKNAQMYYAKAGLNFIRLGIFEGLQTKKNDKAWFYQIDIASPNFDPQTVARNTASNIYAIIGAINDFKTGQASPARNEKEKAQTT